MEMFNEGLKHLIFQKSSQALEWAGQGGGGVTIVEGVQEMCGCGTKEHS